MTLRNIRFVLTATVLGLVAWGDLVSAALEFGHIRARTRGWTEDDQSSSLGAEGKDVTTTGMESVTFEETHYEPTEDLEADDSVIEVAAYHYDATANGKAGPGIGERVMRTVERTVHKGRRLILIGERKPKQPTLRDGYLTVGAPPPLRFSDIDPVNDRPPSPALPEFSVFSTDYYPYLIEEALPEDAMNDAAILSELVIDLEAHEVVSGVIDTSRHTKEELVEHFDLDEHGTTVLRPEEVLIFFETDSNTNSAGAMVPFSPATPSSNTTIKSSATLKKE